MIYCATAMHITCDFCFYAVTCSTIFGDPTIIPFLGNAVGEDEGDHFILEVDSGNNDCYLKIYAIIELGQSTNPRFPTQAYVTSISMYVGPMDIHFRQDNFAVSSLSGRYVIHVTHS